MQHKVRSGKVGYSLTLVHTHRITHNELSFSVLAVNCIFTVGHNLRVVVLGMTREIQSHKCRNLVRDFRFSYEYIDHTLLEKR